MPLFVPGTYRPSLAACYLWMTVSIAGLLVHVLLLATQVVSSSLCRHVTLARDSCCDLQPLRYSHIRALSSVTTDMSPYAWFFPSLLTTAPALSFSRVTYYLVPDSYPIILIRLSAVAYHPRQVHLGISLPRRLFLLVCFLVLARPWSLTWNPVMLLVVHQMFSRPWPLASYPWYAYASGSCSLSP
jgi:hypothetical protein